MRQPINTKAVSIGIGTDTSGIGIGQWYRYRFSRVSVNFFTDTRPLMPHCLVFIFYDI